MTIQKIPRQLSQKIWPCANTLLDMTLPLFVDKISAGFPSPAEGYMDKALDLNELMISSPPSTFFVKVEGESMTGVGIFPGDILIVDRAKEPQDGKIIIAVLDGELTVKRLRRINGTIRLDAENSAYPSITITDERDFNVWGVVTGSVRNF